MEARGDQTVARRRHLSVVGTASDWTAVDWADREADAWIGGRRLHYVDVGSGPPIMLLHGLGMCWQWWLTNLPTLAERHRVIAVDLPGFGQSDSLPLPAEMETHAEVLLELADRLELEPVTVIGHSMGGLITLAMAQRAPERVARVVLVNAGGVPLSEARLRGVVAVVGFACGLLAHPGVKRALTLRPRLRDAVLSFGLYRPDAVTPQLAAQVMPSLPGAGFLDAIAAAARRVRVGVVPVDCPVRLIWGAHDRLLPLSAARQLAHELEDARLEVVQDAGHTPMVEQPGQFDDLVLAFCGEAA